MRKTSIKSLITWAMALMLLLTIPALADANVLALPSGTVTIEQEAFLGDTALEAVVIPEGAKTIGPRAFAGSSVREVTLADTLTSIADDAFDGTSIRAVHVNPGTYAYDWAVEHGYMDIQITCSAETLEQGETATWTVFMPYSAAASTR